MAHRRRGFDDHRRSDDDDYSPDGRRSPSWEGQARNQDVDDRRKRHDDREDGRLEVRDRDDRRGRGDRERDRSRSRSKDRDRRRRRSSEGDDEDRDHSDRERRRGSPGDRSGRDRSSRRRREDRSRSRSSGRGDRLHRSEWYCRCGALNFKRRTTCFRQFCGAQRSDAPPPGTNIPDTYAADDIPGLAAYSAQLYAKNPRERTQYLAYYTNYYSQQLAARPSEADKVNEAAAVAQSAISQVQARTAPVAASAASIPTTAQPETPTGTDNRIYRVPDTSAYVYDPSSGFYYDPSTCLYYDANTHYYYNSQSGQYLYWDASRMTYVLAAAAQAVAAVPTTVTTNPTTPSGEIQPAELKKPVEKQDKVKVAKKIAKDMERWARTLNSKKEAARAGATAEAAAAAGAPSGSADIGFTVLEARPVVSAPLLQAAPPQPALVPSYGAGSDSSDDEEDSIVDRAKLACLLCKRQFPSAEVLNKHMEMSDLHRKNLEEWKKRSGEKGETADSYRDRAAERRLKYGEEEPPPLPKQRKSAQARDGGVESAIPREIGEDNVGKKLLKKMGWSAGQGLGRDGSGRVAPVEARPGQAGVGLGQKRSIYTAVVGETYRSCVRKLTVARYQDLLSTEDNP